VIQRIALLLTLAGAGVASAQDLEGALELARNLAEEHRYSEVIEVLSPFTDLEDAESSYAVAAELGRASFHLGDYSSADRQFRRAVAIRPQRVETALYLEATSYLIGNRDQAYAIFREILASGATDLYLAVTLPGERRFMADPKVWAILEELQRPVAIDLDRGALLGVALGDARGEVERHLGASPGASGDTLTARAGPFLTWAFVFDGDDNLSRIMLHNEHLYRYTPYRLGLAEELDWRAGPEAATTALGAPLETSTIAEDVVIMAWNLGSVRLSLEFAPARTPVPPGLDDRRPSLRVVRIERLGADSSRRIDGPS
jgi:tetratricopeptide (TPR) repeat protein